MNRSFSGGFLLLAPSPKFGFLLFILAFFPIQSFPQSILSDSSLPQKYVSDFDEPETVPPPAAENPAKPPPSGDSPARLPELKKTYRESVALALDFYRQGDYSRAVSVLSRSTPDSEDGAAEMLSEIRDLILMDAHLALGDHKSAVSVGQGYLERHSTNGLALFSYNRALLKSGRTPELTELVDAEMMRELHSNDLRRGESFRRILLKDSLRKKEFVRALDFVETNEDWSELLAAVDDPTAIDELLVEAKNENRMFAAEVRRAELRVANKELPQAKKIIGRIRARPLNPEQKATLAALERKLSGNDERPPIKIGVLLPLKDKRVSYLVAEANKGLWLAFDSFDSGNVRFELVYGDTGASPKKAEREAIRLIEEEKVVALIGPLVKKASASVLKIADSFQVPVISLTKTAGLARNSKYGYRLNYSSEQEAVTLANYAIDYLNAKNFGILVPDTARGLEKSTIFWETVENRGGKVLAFERLPKNIRDLPEVFRRFSDNVRFKVKGDRQGIDTKSISAKSRSIDAIYIPADVRMLGYVGDFLSAYSLGHAKVLTGEEISPRQMLLVPNKKQVENASVFFSGGLYDRFNEAYWRNYHEVGYFIPPGNYAFYSYVAFVLIAESVTDFQAFTPYELNDRLQTYRKPPDNFRGIPVKLQENRDLITPLTVIRGKGNSSRSAFIVPNVL